MPNSFAQQLLNPVHLFSQFLIEPVSQALVLLINVDLESAHFGISAGLCGLDMLELCFKLSKTLFDCIRIHRDITILGFLSIGTQLLFKIGFQSSQSGGSGAGCNGCCGCLGSGCRVLSIWIPGSECNHGSTAVACKCSMVFLEATTEC